MIRTAFLSALVTLVLMIMASGVRGQTKPKQNPPSNSKMKFYDFDDMLIDGEYKKPQILYTDTRQKVRFERLLKLKKSFLPKLMDTARDPALR
ncbi:MAG: hypothetical protein VXX11_03320 [Planctomycetota bacterium]|nr:hypothetical protein [Planctomycetota bacterium]